MALDNMKGGRTQNGLYEFLPPLGHRYMASKQSDSCDELDAATLELTSKHKPNITSLDSGSEDDETLAGSEFGLLREVQKVPFDGAQKVPFDGAQKVPADYARKLPLIDVQKLPRVDTEVVVKIQVTRDPPQLTENSEKQNILNEYTCGDTVYGFVMIQNDSYRPTMFETLSLSLEGHIVVVDGLTRSRTCKNILSMTDSGATCIRSKLLGSDDEICDLPKDRILRPHIKYKRYFSFRLPDNLSKSTCPQGNLSHCGLPPSFGLDKHHNCFKYRELNINEFLGYARSKVRGSPVWVSDLAQDVSISYAVNAVLVGKKAKRQELFVMQEFEHFLRVVPPKVGSTTNYANEDLETLTAAAAPSLSTLTGDCNDMNSEIEVYSSKNGKYSSTNGPSGLVEHRLPYRIDQRLSLKDKLFRRHTRTKNQKAFGISGLIVLNAQVPSLALSYQTSGLITKDNMLEFKSTDDQENRFRIKDEVPIDQRMPLKEITVDITCTPSSNSTLRKLPQIRAVDAELICITGKSRNHILDQCCNATILGNSRVDELEDLCDRRTRAARSHKNTFDRYQKKIQDKSDSTQSQLDADPLEDLELKIDHLRDVFSNQANKKWNTRANTKKRFLGGRKNRWSSYGPGFKQHVPVSLEYGKDFQGTLVPDFTNCMCFRLYRIRVIITFGDGVGDAMLDIPVNVRNTFF